MTKDGKLGIYEVSQLIKDLIRKRSNDKCFVCVCLYFCCVLCVCGVYVDVCVMCTFVFVIHTDGYVPPRRKGLPYVSIISTKRKVR